MMTTATSTPSTQGKLKGWHVLLIMMGFFGVMFAVNGVFLYHAITSFPGEDIEKSYLQGLDYNTTLAERAAQSERAWQVEIGLSNGELAVQLHDGAGTPLTGLDVTVQLRRGGQRNLDQSIRLLPQGAGRYVAPVAPMVQGAWQSQITVIDPTIDAIKLSAQKRLIVR